MKNVYLTIISCLRCRRMILVTTTNINSAIVDDQLSYDIRVTKVHSNVHRCQSLGITIYHWAPSLRQDTHNLCIASFSSLEKSTAASTEIGTCFVKQWNEPMEF